MKGNSKEIIKPESDGGRVLDISLPYLNIALCVLVFAGYNSPGVDSENRGRISGHTIHHSPQSPSNLSHYHTAVSSNLCWGSMWHPSGYMVTKLTKHKWCKNHIKNSCIECNALHRSCMQVLDETIQSSRKLRSLFQTVRENFHFQKYEHIVFFTSIKGDI